MNFIQNDANIINSFSRFSIGYLKSQNLIGEKVDSLTAESWAWKLASIKILSVYTLIDVNNEPMISARELVIVKKSSVIVENKIWQTVIYLHPCNPQNTCTVLLYGIFLNNLSDNVQTLM